MADGLVFVPVRRSIVGVIHWEVPHIVQRCEVVVDYVQEMLLRHGVIALDVCTQTGCILRPETTGKHMYIFISRRRDTKYSLQSARRNRSGLH